MKGHSLRLDDILRQKVKTLQCKNSDDLTLLEMEELVDGLRNIESKFVYQREILDLAISKAVDAHDMSLAAKFLVASLIVKSIIDVRILFIIWYMFCYNACYQFLNAELIGIFSNRIKVLAMKMEILKKCYTMDWAYNSLSQ